MKQFELTMVIEGDADVTAEQLMHAFHIILKRAMRFSPDRRFDWGRALTHAEERPKEA